MYVSGCQRTNFRIFLNLQKIFCVLYILSSTSVAFALTPANTQIQSFATVTYHENGNPFTQQSNIDSFKVAQIVDLTNISDNPSGVPVLSPATSKVLSFTLTNTGNGPEGFSLSATNALGDDFDASNVQIYLDSNSNGTFDSGTDALYVPGTNDPILNQSQSMHIFVVGDIPAGQALNAIANISLKATSLIGTGSPGMTFVGAGVGGVDAILGSEGGAVSVQNSFKIGSYVVLTKTSAVVDPLGGTHPYSGATITYTLVLQIVGTESATNLVISDNIPAGTTYIAGSLKLNNVTLTDAALDDAGTFTGTGISVSIGTVAPPTTATVTFKVRIQ